MARQTEEGLPGSGGNSKFTENPQPRYVHSPHKKEVADWAGDKGCQLVLLYGVGIGLAEWADMGKGPFTNDVSREEGGTQILMR